MSLFVYRAYCFIKASNAFTSFAKAVYSGVLVVSVASLDFKDFSKPRKYNKDISVDISSPVVPSFIFAGFVLAGVPVDGTVASAVLYWLIILTAVLVDKNLLISVYNVGLAL